jgi:hypothetical protein
MISIQKINSFLIVLMFIISVSGVKLLSFLDLKIVGLDYMIWGGFAILLLLFNFSAFKKNLLINRLYLSLVTMLLVIITLNYFFVNVDIMIYLMGTFFTILFIINYILFYNIYSSREMILSCMKGIVFFLTLIILAIYIERFFFIASDDITLREATTLTKDSGMASALFNINIILSLVLYHLLRKKRYIWIIALSLITILFMFFLKSIITSILVLFLYLWFFSPDQYKKYAVYTAGFIALLIITAGGEQLYDKVDSYIEMYVTGLKSEKIPRNALYIASIEIASDYFPFGCGQGIFGSYPVGYYYSQIYFDYDLKGLHGLGPDAYTSDANFLFDTFWSHIIGELGFIGSLFYFFIWIFPAVAAFRLLSSKDVNKKILAFFVVTTTIIIFIQSFAISIPEQLQFIIIYAGLGGISLRLLNNSNNITS